VRIQPGQVKVPPLRKILADTHNNCMPLPIFVMPARTDRFNKTIELIAQATQDATEDED
jgi:hypothetical protein